MKLRAYSKWIWILVVGLALILLPFFFPSFWLSLVIQMLILGILAMSLNILLGYTGLPSFGHSGFFGTAAYVVGIMTTRYKVGFWLSGLSSLVLTTSVAALFGLLVTHSSGVYFLMITMALGMVLWGLAFRWVSMTGGDNGISGIPRPALGLSIDLNHPVVFYYFTLVVFCLVLWAIYVLIKSPFGWSLKGIRESESRMGALGYNTWLHKYFSYIVAGGFAGIAGVLWAFYNGFVGPHDLDLVATMETFFMVILGGSGTLFGPIVGAGVLIFLKNFISAYTHRWLIILGVIYIVIILYAPRGLVNLWVNKPVTKEKPEDLFRGSQVNQREI
jgi:branched-chain amino acid transport system permease protein